VLLDPLVPEEASSMATIDPLLERNKHCATTAAREGISIVAKYPMYVIACLDPAPTRRHAWGSRSAMRW
jgi:hypothetical protein